jgi:Flp pilus assembly pilin Flp
MNRHRGQGMTEYLIIVALIAVAAIGVYTYYGNVVKGQSGGIAAALGGQSGSQATNKARNQGGLANTRGAASKDLTNFNSDNQVGNEPSASPN